MSLSQNFKEHASESQANLSSNKQTVTLDQIPLTETLCVLRLQNETIDELEARIVTETLCVFHWQTETLDRLEP